MPQKGYHIEMIEENRLHISANVVKITDNQLPIPIYMELSCKASFPEYIMVSVHPECARMVLTILDTSDHGAPVQNVER